MEIQVLKLAISEQDLNDLIPELLGPNQQVKDLRIRVSPEGVQISGIYQLMIGVHFDALWRPAIWDGGLLAISLADFKVVGFGGSMLKGAVMSALGDLAAQKEGVHVDGDTLVIEPDHIMLRKGLPVKTNLTAVYCDTGWVVVEGGSPAE